MGDTSENYPDEAGAAGSPAWGGIRYDHYPDIHRDDRGCCLPMPDRTPPLTALPEGLFAPVECFTRRNVYRAYRG